MTEFLRILAVYYMCDQAAAIRPLSPEEFTGCQRTYEAVKRYFSDFDTAKPVDVAARNRSAYIGFKTWEADNAELVSRMKAAALAKVGG